jgi:hypothetical protein
MKILRAPLAAVVAAAALAAAACGGSDADSSASGGEPPAAGTGAAPPSQGAPLPGGGLTIEEAIASTLEGPLMVKGFLVAPDGEPIRLCSALLESYPPQCGEPSLVVEGLDLESVEGLTRAEEPQYAHTAWTDAEISLLGDIEDGVLSLSETSI